MELTTQNIQELITKYYSNIFKNDEIPLSIICGQVTHESSGDTTAFAGDRNGGSYGLMQVDKTALSTIGFSDNTDLYNPDLNVQVGMTYDKEFYYGKVNNPDILNINDHALRIAMTLISYNAGPENFEEMYNNHLANGNIKTWQDAINNESLVSNWSSVISYPVIIFYNANQYYGLQSNGTINNSYFSVPVILF